jgi:prepilin-type N-terminal cleavage/methylation domain-containing protein
MKRIKGFTLIELMVVIVIIGLLASIAIPSFMRLQNRAKESKVRGNCHTVQLAAEDFAIQNGGVYAADTDTDQTPTGATIQDMLPGGTLLENPYTNAATEPLSSGVAALPGETGYAPIVGPTGLNDGYSITGFGLSRIITTLSNGN